MSHNVVIVESPAKAKTINKYLGNDYVVLASYGHIRDLPSKNGSVNPDDHFAMIWEMDDRSQRHVDAIVKAVKKADHVYLATDPDREGEAISWHVLQVLNESKALKKQDVYRVVFNEITKNAVKKSFETPRQIDQSLVDAYLARRALDYLVGFTLSPVLWRKLPGSKSAGRVQSVALRLIVDREVEIERFISQEYWSVIGKFASQTGTVFEARLTHLEGKKLDKFSLNNAQLANEAVSVLKPLAYHVETIEKKQVKRNPAAPFITSTLQQEASRKLGFGASRTMQIAQKLYEGVEINGETFGLITYMRTDSPVMSGDAITEARTYLDQTFGKNYVPATPRLFKAKAKNAQEAHECIRPTRFALTPSEVAAYLDQQQLRLYELIWKRALASQMENALFDQVSADITDPSQNYVFRATGSTQVFDGFLRLYQEGKDEPSDDDDNKSLPLLTKNQNVLVESIDPHQHFTQPPPRYSEASLVKKMEELGIGRPSTYAPVLQVLQDRRYVKLEKRYFIPEDRGRIVTSFLIRYFPKYVEYDFTAHLEEELDNICEGQLSWRQVLTTFWKDFKQNIDATSSLTITDVINTLENDLALFLYASDKAEDKLCPVCKNGMMHLKLSKFGAFLGCANYPECKHTRPLIEGGEEAGSASAEDRVLGMDPALQVPVVLKKGPYGYYFEWQGYVEPSQDLTAVKTPTDTDKPATKKRATKKSTKAEKPKRVSLPATVKPDDATLELALKMATLPYHVGIHPGDGLNISVNYGRFGPYIKHSSLFVSIPKAYDYFSISLEQALDLIEKKKQRPPRARPEKKIPKSPVRKSKKA